MTHIFEMKYSTNFAIIQTNCISIGDLQSNLTERYMQDLIMFLRIQCIDRNLRYIKFYFNVNTITAEFFPYLI